MRNKRPLVLLLLACCLALPVLGVAQGVTIFGRPDCGLWLSKLNEKTPQMHEICVYILTKHYFSANSCSQNFGSSRLDNIATCFENEKIMSSMSKLWKMYI